MRKSKVIMNLLWRFMERCGAQVVALTVSIILGRVLDPDIYGTVALVTVFTTILQVFVDSGLANALIQKKDADDVDFSSVFYFNIVVCLCLYGLIFLCAPAIANLYERPELVPIVRVLSVIVIISGVKNVQMAYISRTLQFKRFFVATLFSTVTAAVVGIVMAYSGYGVWALVAHDLVSQGLSTLILWFTVKWRPRAVFSWSRMKALYSFGWKLLASSLIDHLYNEARQLIIGKMYSAADLAFFNRGKQFPQAISTNVNATIDSVMFPVLSSEQSDPEKLKRMTRRSIKTSAYIMSPLMIGFAAIAESFVLLLLTEKWLPAVDFMRVFCLTFLVQPIHSANMNAIKAMGRSDLFLKIDIIKRVIGFVVLFTTIWFGPLVMAYSMLASNVLSQVIVAWPNRQLLKYGVTEQLRDVLPALVLSGIMFAVIYPLQLLQLSAGLTMLLQIVCGMVVYVALSALLKIDTFQYILQTVRGMLGRKKNRAGAAAEAD